jgi:hypothetical protein
MIKLQTGLDNTLGSIKILKCKDWMYWYNNEIGNTFNFYSENFDCYWVRDKDGYRNTVLKSDCEQIYPNDELRISELINEKEKE